ncbi:pyridoxamine 5'-phosphate oxidase family protein [Microbacterium sp. 10M-3C3]|jgi:PPOX class probable F420-dependent enzyme|uniref:pyridoxamine 5'-phosphate oxidase family protein n=1 Tax=Microbacterium sp. 10M-3C3 TaxID=2483401 RepID=UPI0013DDACE2|nr:pyridoxamine 5'-phosphate oxidase family protein [Microbacterium sp. 10M-3C3]
MAQRFDPSDAAQQAALELLRTRTIAWFTTVDRGGAPHAVPVWFFWHDGAVLVFSEDATAKVRHVRAGSPVLVHLETGRFGNEVLILSGAAEISERDSASWLTEFRDTYIAKYADAIADYGQPIDDIMRTFATTIVFRPETLLAW